MQCLTEFSAKQVSKLEKKASVYLWIITLQINRAEQCIYTIVSCKLQHFCLQMDCNTRHTTCQVDRQHHLNSHLWVMAIPMPCKLLLFHGRVGMETQTDHPTLRWPSGVPKLQLGFEFSPVFRHFLVTFSTVAGSNSQRLWSNIVLLTCAVLQHFMNPNKGWVKAEQGILQNCMVAPAVSCLVSHELCTELWCCCTPWTVLLPFTAPCLEAQSISSWEELPAPSNPCGWEQHPSAPWHLVA